MQHNTLDKIGHRSGETVPEGYFEQFRTRMKIELPERKWERESSVSEAIADRTWWQKLRPYAYMAAMFAGIWLMMNMFTLFHPARTGGLDSNPSLIAALSNDSFFSDYVTPDVDDYDLYESLYDSGFDPSSVKDW